MASRERGRHPRVWRQFLMITTKVRYHELIQSLLRCSVEAVLRPGRAAMEDVTKQFWAVGVMAVPLVGVITFFVGYVLAMVLYLQLAKLGIGGRLPGFLWVMLSEQIVPLSVAMVIIGRSVSALTAELGSMQVGEEIKALHTMGINVTSFLLWPRFIAFICMSPALTLVGIYLALVGGYAFCGVAQAIAPSNFFDAALENARLSSIWLALAKAVIFSFLAVIIALRRGLNVREGSREISEATTSAVVTSVVAVTLANAALTTLQLFALT